jgi:DNA polymerase-3 subunit beta
MLRSVRVEAQPDVLLLSATDLELSLRCALTQVEVSEPGVTLVVAETLARIVKECTDELLSIETIENLLHVQGHGSHFQIVTHDPADFPAIPKIEGEPDIIVDCAVLRRLVDWTVFASARESTRYAINGVLWDVGEHDITLAATDGRRLSVAHGDLIRGGEAHGGLQAIVPARALSLLARLPVDPGTRVGVKITANQLLADVGRVMISTSLVEGNFPRYRDVIPTDCNRVVELDTAEFSSALKRAALLTNEESKGVRFAFSEGTLTLSSRAPEQGEAEIVFLVAYHGEPVEIGFNPVYLLEVLRATTAEKITFAFKEPNRPGIVRVGNDYTYVVMPVSLSSA